MDKREHWVHRGVWKVEVKVGDIEKLWGRVKKITFVKRKLGLGGCQINRRNFSFLI